MIRARFERELDFDASPTWDEAYFDAVSPAQPGLDGALWKEPLTAIPTRPLLVCDADTSVRAAMQAMQQGHRGYVVITEDGTARTRLTGIFTERDILLRVIDGGRNPAEIRIGDVMTRDPETLPVDARIAWALNMMSIGGFRHVPVVDREGRPTAVVAVRDIVELLVESFPAEILNLPPDFGRKKSRARDGA
jgi:CBS domain-containing protein